MTPVLLAEQSARKLSIAVRAAAGQIRDRIGRVRWTLILPVWQVMTSPEVLAELGKLGIELGIKAVQPEVLPILEAATPLATRLVSDSAALQRYSDALALLRTTTFSDAALAAFEAIEAQGFSVQTTLQPETPPDAPSRGPIHVG
jgi:hypothetical protein